MPKPLVAVVCYHLAEGRVTRWDSGAFAVPDEYEAAIRRAGGRAALLAGPIDADEDPGALVGRFDGVLLVGGGDVEPDRYGSTERHPDLYGMDPDRDRFEIELLLAADRAGAPTLAVCRGAQVMNVAFGGTLHQHLPDRPEFHGHRRPEKVGYLHEVRVAEGSRLWECTGGPVQGYSAHHQGLDRLGERLMAVGWSDDGLVEAVERPEGWMLGVQWHPERTAADDPLQQRLFDRLVEQAAWGRPDRGAQPSAWAPGGGPAG